jgi:ADP-dependent NAD(P)H-hydrate dehydratase
VDEVKQIPPLPPRPAEGHKGLFGRVLVVGGSDEMIGAPVLAGRAALRTGAGLVQIAMPAAVLAAAVSVTPELIGLGLKRARDEMRLMDAAKQADAVALGPGLGQSPDARRRVMRMLRLERPMVIDADALNTLAGRKAFPAIAAAAVLTPHPGEMKRLARHLGRDEVPADDDGRIELAAEAARAFGQVIVLKGARTVITDGRRYHLNTTGDSSLSKAGTGDVLTGIIACLLAQEMECFDAAVVGTHLHGRAGELAGERVGQRSVLAWEVIEAIPAAIREYEADSH